MDYRPDHMNLLKTSSNGGCASLILFVIFLLAGIFALAYTYLKEYTIGGPNLYLFFSPVVGFAISSFTISFFMYKSWLQLRIKPESPFIFDPERKYRRRKRAIISWGITFLFLFWVFLTEWNFVFIDFPGLLFIFLIVFIVITGYFIWYYLNLITDSTIDKTQRSFGKSTLYIPGVEKNISSNSMIDVELVNSHFGDSIKTAKIIIRNISEQYDHNAEDIKSQIIYSETYNAEILTGRAVTQCYIPEDGVLPVNYKAQPLIYWELEVNDENSDYFARFFLPVSE
ncbi:MAG: hypothetical protein HKN67_02485 [Saprospiraceae bacterium]|nr:hypothetical protein [Saprospiraceae bacterium]